MKLLHTADVHLDAPNKALGDRAADLRECTWSAWERVVEVALDTDVEMVIVAGDLFDTREPAPATIDRAFHDLRRLTDASIDVILLPGTHDCWAPDKLWDSPRVRALPDRVHVLPGPDPVTVHLPHLDTAVHGCAHRCDGRDQRPLCELRADPDVAVNLGVAHASLERGDVEDEALFGEDELQATEMDYVALGHWHTWQDVSAGDVPAILPGSVEVPGFGDWQTASVALVTVGDGPARVERVEVGSLRGRKITIDAGDLAGTEDLVAEVERHADGDLLLSVRLEGLAPPGTVIETDTAMERLEEAFFALRIRDRSHPAMDEIEDEHLDDRLTLGRFVKLARERIEAAEGEDERRVAERALQIGVSMLSRSGGNR